MRNKKQRIDIAERILEAYRGSSRYGSYRTAAGHTKQRDEYEDPDEVKRHNAAIAKKMKAKKDAKERLKTQNIVPKKDGKPMFENKGNTLAGKQSYGKSLIGQTFYIICPDDSRYYKTIYIRFNPFTNAMQPMMSNKVYGEPPDTLEPINPLILQRLLRLEQSTTFKGL